MAELDLLTQAKKGTWMPSDSAALYGIPDWGQGYFDVNAAGHIAVLPYKAQNQQVDLFEIVEALGERGYQTPLLVRFSDILAHRLREMRTTFDRARKEVDYRGGYSCVYPIKVNQQRHICEEICEFGAAEGFGLEAGSKPELLAVLALTVGRESMPIICNGFKDNEFIEMVTLAAKLGRKIIPVVEKFSELEAIVKYAKLYDVRPLIGVRVKLSTRGVGRWESSAGTKSKFGLLVSEVLTAVEYLKSHGMLDCLTLLHCHIGSQVYNIRNIVNAVTELTHIYTELRRLGATMGMLDIGGGLGVDYDGSRSPQLSSINYSLQEYAENVLWRVKSVCDEAEVEHPLIISESGRAMVAYGSVLVCDVLGKTLHGTPPDMERIRAILASEEEVPHPLNDLLDAYERVETGNMQEVFHDATQARDEVRVLFSLRHMTLPLRAVSEHLFWGIGRKLLDRALAGLDPGEPLPDEFAELPEMLSDTYFCNFSLFQSAPDSWAIDQVFPVCPIHRLDEKPIYQGTLADITCDSDGRVSRFVGYPEQKHTLELHDLRPSADGNGREPYYLGFFLVGAYQETLGDLHNLFGDTHAVHIRLAEDGDWTIEEVVEGDSVREVLSYVQFDHKLMRSAMRKDVEQAVKSSRLSVKDGKSLLQFYEDGLDGYTYFED
jgi:arginine decarboxylase